MVKAVFVDGDAFLAEVRIEDISYPTWQTIPGKGWTGGNIGHPHDPIPDRVAKRGIENALRAARADVVNYRRVREFRRLLCSPIKHRRWTLVVAMVVVAIGILVWWDAAFEGRTLSLWCYTHHSLLGRLESRLWVGLGSYLQWPVGFLFLLLSGVVLYRSLPPRLPEKVPVTERNIPFGAGGNPPFDIEDASASGAFYVAYLEYFYKFLEVDSRCVVATNVGPEGSFVGVGLWEKKIQAIDKDDSVRCLVFALSDKPDVEKAWGSLPGRAGFKQWDEDRSSGCLRVRYKYPNERGRELTFLACPNSASLLRYWNPSQGDWNWGWTLLRVALAVLICLPFFFSIYPELSLKVSFPGQLSSSKGRGGVPQTKVISGQEISMTVEVYGCEEEAIVFLEVKANGNSEVITDTPQGKTRNRWPDKLFCGTQKKLFLRLPPQRDEVLLTLRVTHMNFCWDGESREYRLVRAG